MSLLTYEDAIDHLFDVFGIDNRDRRNVRMARRCVQKVLNDWPTKHRWNYYERHGQFTTVASSEDTFAYDHSGGASERLVTLASTTLSSDDAHLYEILSGEVVYEIDQYVSSSTATLKANTNPGADVAAGTACTVMRPRYALPSDFRRFTTSPVDLGRSFTLQMVSPSELLEAQGGNYQPSESRWGSVVNQGEAYGGWYLEMAPPPSIARTWDYVYEADARRLKVERYADGTVTTDGTTTVTGSGTAWTASMVGAILRVPASGGTAPGGVVGSLESDTPFDEERKITAVASAASLTVESAITTRTAVGYTISDPIDLDASSMGQAFLRWCEYEFSRMSRESLDKIREYKMSAEEELRDARIADNRMREIGMSSSASLPMWEQAYPTGVAPGDIV